MGHEVPMPSAPTGMGKLADMATLALSEALQDVLPMRACPWPLLLCLPRPRTGFDADAEKTLVAHVESGIGMKFTTGMVAVCHGRTGVAVALRHARQMLEHMSVDRVVILAVDSLLDARILEHYLESDRLLTSVNSNGFMPGEAAAALVVGRPEDRKRLEVLGVGFGMEEAHIDSERPLRADGMLQAIQNAVRDAACEVHDVDFRVTDLAGEHYYFKEAALALQRGLRRRKEEFETWHAAECIGETGAVAGMAGLCWIDEACRKGYAPGTRVLLHLSDDAGQRAALILNYGR